jgi:cardiolipin synthase
MRVVGIASAIGLGMCLLLVLGGCTAPLGTPSQFTLVQYPAAGFAGIYAQTAAAKKSIDMEMYELEDPQEIGALIAAKRRGVAVRVLLDSAYEVKDTNQPAYSTLTLSHVAVRFAPSGTIYHAKVTTFDGATSDISTANLTPQYYRTTRDAEIVDTNPAQVRAIEGTFDHDWNGQSAAGDEVNTRGLVWSPDAESTMVDLIHSAKQSVRFTSEELSDPYISNALADDAIRGLRCEVVMMDEPDWQKAFGIVSRAGCVVRVLPDTPTGFYMHEKLLLIDSGASSAKMLLGSQNASYSSLSFNRELSLELTEPESPGILGAARVTFDQDFAKAKPWTG